MTTLTTPERQEAAAVLPVPWRRMAWVTWRQHRVALAGVAVLLAALAAYMWGDGLRLYHAYAAAAACHPAGSLACTALASNFSNTYASHVQLVTDMLQAVPALIGAFTGAPVLARELETGTYRFAWTQGFGRSRWTLGKLVPLAVVLAAAAGACSLLFSWYSQPFFADGKLVPLSPDLFALRGVAFAAWALAAFTIGALAGMLIRRVVPAIAATLVAYAGLALVTDIFLRPHYLTPVVARDLLPPRGAWVKGLSYAHDGKPVSQIEIIRALQHFRVTSLQYLPHSYSWRITYQPASRFWSFQWIEGGWLLALSVLLIATTIWLVRRKAS